MKSRVCILLSFGAALASQTLLGDWPAVPPSRPSWDVSNALTIAISSISNDARKYSCTSASWLGATPDGNFIKENKESWSFNFSDNQMSRKVEVFRSGKVRLEDQWKIHTKTNSTPILMALASCSGLVDTNYQYIFAAWTWSDSGYWNVKVWNQIKKTERVLKVLNGVAYEDEEFVRRCWDIGKNRLKDEYLPDQQLNQFNKTDTSLPIR